MILVIDYNEVSVWNFYKNCYGLNIFYIHSYNIVQNKLAATCPKILVCDLSGKTKTKSAT